MSGKKNMIKEELIHHKCIPIDTLKFADELSYQARETVERKGKCNSVVKGCFHFLHYSFNEKKQNAICYISRNNHDDVVGWMLVKNHSRINPNKFCNLVYAWEGRNGKVSVKNEMRSNLAVLNKYSGNDLPKSKKRNRKEEDISQTSKKASSKKKKGSLTIPVPMSLWLNATSKGSNDFCNSFCEEVKESWPLEDHQHIDIDNYPNVLWTWYCDNGMVPKFLCDRTTDFVKMSNIGNGQWIQSGLMTFVK